MQASKVQVLQKVYVQAAPSTLASQPAEPIHCLLPDALNRVDKCLNGHLDRTTIRPVQVDDQHDQQGQQHQALLPSHAAREGARM